MKAEASALLAFAALYLLMGGQPAVTASPGVAGTEVWLAFSLVFTFVVGMEVVR